MLSRPEANENISAIVNVDVLKSLSGVYKEEISYISKCEEGSDSQNRLHHCLLDSA